MSRYVEQTPAGNWPLRHPHQSAGHAAALIFSHSSAEGTGAGGTPTWNVLISSLPLAHMVDEELARLPTETLRDLFRVS